jgi:hypothetical protein
LNTVSITGFMGGNYYKDNGGPANYLCLPEDPSWAKYQDGIQSRFSKGIYDTFSNHHRE